MNRFSLLATIRLIENGMRAPPVPLLIYHRNKSGRRRRNLQSFHPALFGFFLFLHSFIVPPDKSGGIAFLFAAVWCHLLFNVDAIFSNISIRVRMKFVGERSETTWLVWKQAIGRLSRDVIEPFNRDKSRRWDLYLKLKRNKLSTDFESSSCWLRRRRWIMWQIAT